MAEPSDAANMRVALRKSASRGAKFGVVSAEHHAPPARAQDRCRCKKATVPRFPICYPGFGRAEVNELHGRDGAGDWWGQEFEMGRAPFDSKYSTVWHAFFESCVPAE